MIFRVIEQGVFPLDRGTRMAGRAADRGWPRRMGGCASAYERMGRGGWAAADGSRQIADGSARPLDASVIAGAGQSSRSGCANPQCEPGSWAGQDGDENDQGRHGTLSVAPRERRSFAAQLDCKGPWHQTLLAHNLQSISRASWARGSRRLAGWDWLAGLNCHASSTS